MLKIAVCDDNRQMLDKVEGILQNYRKINDVPMSVDTYESAIELMDALRKNDYGILILDIIMPGFTGMQAAQEIRKFNEEIKII
ncbi:MAG: response regulator, partial [Clostridia bacterium]|nr:response regulator [Clostridia bacterium]